MARSSACVIIGVIVILLLLFLLSACLELSIVGKNDVWLAIVVIVVGLIVFAICILTAQDSGIIWISSPEHIRATIAVSIVIEYMVLVGIVAFFTGRKLTHLKRRIL
jgi:hypothetical protein